MDDLATLMRDRVAGAQPDVEALLSGALREGRRLCRRRRMAYAGAGLAVAAVACLGAVTLGSPGGTTATELQPAASGPTASSSARTSTVTGLQVGDVLRFGRLTGTVVSCAEGKPDPIGGNPACILPARDHFLGASTRPGPGTGLAVVISGTPVSVSRFWSNGFGDLTVRFPGVTVAAADSVWSAINPDAYAGHDVQIHLAGWSQVGGVGDDKQSLAGPSGAEADIVWRRASDYAAWQRGEKADPLTWTSTVHDGVFVTIQAGRGTTSADVRALGRSLTWK
jgi:hypothetical protein